MPEQVRNWVEGGCLVQVTAGSFLGRFGKRAERSAWQLLRHDMVHFIASDGHNATSRPPLLSDARRAIAAERGEETARALCETNPRAAVDSRPLPWQPEAQPIQPRRWFSFHR